MHLLYVIVIGFVAGLLARILSPAPNNPQGFVLTTMLGMVGAVVANLIEQSIHGGRGEGVGWIGATVGAIIVLAIWHWLIPSREDPRL